MKYSLLFVGAKIDFMIKKFQLWLTLTSKKIFVNALERKITKLKKIDKKETNTKYTIYIVLAQILQKHMSNKKKKTIKQQKIITLIINWNVQKLY